MIEVRITDDEVISRVMFPFPVWGFPDIRVNLAGIIAVRRGALWGSFPTVQILYRSADGATQCLEHVFTTFLPLPLVTAGGEEFLETLEAVRRRASDDKHQ